MLERRCERHQIDTPTVRPDKPGRLSDEERKKIEAHPVIGYETLKGTPTFRPKYWTPSATTMNV